MRESMFQPPPVWRPTSLASRPVLTQRLLRTPEDLEEVREVWTQLQNHPEVDFDYFVRRLQIDKCEAFVMAFYMHGECVALLCGLIRQTLFQIESGGHVFFQTRVRQLGFCSGSFMGLTNEQLSEFAVDQLLPAMVAEKIDVLAYHDLNWTEPLRRLLQSKPPILCRDLLARSRNYWVFQLPGSLEEVFQKRLSKKRRYWARRSIRLLEKSFPGRVQFVRCSSTEGLPGLFRDVSIIARQTRLWQKGLGYCERLDQQEMIAEFARKKALRAIILYLDDQPVSYWICIRQRRKLYLYFTGYLPTFSRYEPGTIALFQVIDDACREGIECLYMGSGQYPYKEKYSNAHFPTGNLLAFSASTRGITLNSLRWAILGPIELIRRGAVLFGIERMLNAISRH